MKLNGAPLTNTLVRTYALPRVGGDPLMLQLQPLSLGFHQRLRERGIVLPVPPLKIARDAGGKPQRDAQGNAVTLQDVNQPDFRRDLDRYHQRVAVLAVAESLRGDPCLTFDSPVPVSAEGWPIYADNLFTEMEQAGFTAGDLILLCREVCRLSNLLEEHLAHAQQNFSQQAENESS
ncbi:hypothetical protein [Planctomicrobium sp. SH664]|uniref:hypothetical protein n=1 Tax=Planctomicrobium sp. SH664 TaxID=3448125 RepID=UPI003F5C7EE1